MIFILYSNDRGRSPSPLEDQQAAESGEEGPSKDELSSDDQPENLSNMSSHMRLHDQLLRRLIDKKIQGHICLCLHNHNLFIRSNNQS